MSCIQSYIDQQSELLRKWRCYENQPYVDKHNIIEGWRSNNKL